MQREARSVGVTLHLFLMKQHSVCLAVLGLVLTSCGVAPGDTPQAAVGELVANAPDGYRVTLEASLDEQTGAPAIMRRMLRPTLTVRVRQGRARLEFGGIAPPGTPKGAYLLVDARAPREALLVVPERQEAMRSVGAENYSAKGPPLEVVDTVARIEDLGVGEPVLGLPTHKYRMTIGYSLRSPGAIDPPLWRTEIVRTMHVSDRVAGLDPVFAQFPDLLRAAPPTNMSFQPGTARQIDALAQRAPPGFVLLQRTESRSIVRTDTTRSSNTWRVTSITQGGVSAADVELPAGFRVRSPSEPRTTTF